MGIETGILGSNQRSHQIGRQVAIIDIRTVFDKEVPDILAIGRDDLGSQIAAGIFEFFERGEFPERPQPD